MVVVVKITTRYIDMALLNYKSEEFARTADVEIAEFILVSYHSFEDKQDLLMTLVEQDKTTSAKVLTNLIRNKKVNLMKTIEPMFALVNQLLLDTESRDAVTDMILGCCKLLAVTCPEKVRCTENYKNTVKVVESFGIEYSNPIIGKVINTLLNPKPSTPENSEVSAENTVQNE